jgi:hypothetical protein
LQIIVEGKDEALRAVVYAAMPNRFFWKGKRAQFIFKIRPKGVQSRQIIVLIIHSPTPPLIMSRH